MYRPGPQQPRSDWCRLSIVSPTSGERDTPCPRTLCLPRGLACWGQGSLLLRPIELPATAFVSLILMWPKPVFSSYLWIFIYMITYSDKYSFIFSSPLFIFNVILYWQYLPQQCWIIMVLLGSFLSQSLSLFLFLIFLVSLRISWYFQVRSNCFEVSTLLCVRQTPSYSYFWISKYIY